MCANFARSYGNLELSAQVDAHLSRFHCLLGMYEQMCTHLVRPWLVHADPHLHQLVHIGMMQVEQRVTW